jgi:hypothetical protein
MSSALEGPGMNQKSSQVPDEVEENEGSQDAVERDVGEEETQVVANSPG